MSDAEPPLKCPVVGSFIARQGILLLAALLFLLYVYVQVQRGKEKRDLRTMAADISKQAGQQAFGGAVMVALGILLAQNSFDSLAWYGAEYPFEVVLTTYFTGKLRHWTERGFARWHERTGAAWLEPYTKFGLYGPTPGEFRGDWYAAQMVQAVLLIGIPARLGSVVLILASLALPGAASPVRLVARTWYESGLTCTQRAAATLYVMPVLGDAVQFVIVDQLQRFDAKGTAPAAAFAPPAAAPAPGKPRASDGLLGRMRHGRDAVRRGLGFGPAAEVLELH